MSRVEYWRCRWCKQEWPANTTVEAVRKHKKANEVHPGKQCEPADSSQ